MSKKKREPDSSRHISPRIAFYLPEALYQELTNYIETSRLKPTMSQVVRVAIEAFLEEERKKR